MADVLLTELSNADIDWIVTTGKQRQVQAGTVLLEPGQHPDTVSVLLDGALAIRSPATVLHGAIDGHSEWEIAHLHRGEILGETALLDLPPIAAVIQATEDSLVLSIPQRQWVAKLQQDSSFAAHIYRAIALILSKRLRRILEMPGNLQPTTDQPIKEALFVFGELRDGDIDWLVSIGQVESLAPDKVLIHAGRPIDALYIVLDGLLSLSVPEGNCDPLSLCFHGLEQTRTYQKAIANLSRGELAGTVSFLDFQPLPTTVRAVKESLVLAIPRQQLASKLQQDLGFAARFYRVLAIQLANNLQNAMGRMGWENNPYANQQPMNDAIQYDDELDVETLERFSHGAARFNWMLKRLGVFN